MLIQVKILKFLIVRLGIALEFLVGPVINKISLNSRQILIYPQSGIGDQILTASAYLQLSSRVKLHLILPAGIAAGTSRMLNHFPITIHERSEPKLRHLYSEYFQCLAFSVSLRSGFISLSDLQLRYIKYGLPYKHPNEICYEILGLDFNSYNCPNLVQQLFPNLGGITNSVNKPYAIIDHFPGTSREIPSSVFEDLEGRGLEIVSPSKTAEFKDLRGLLEGASELHLVNSSFLCLALMINPDVKSKNIYMTQNGFVNGHRFYDQNWNELWMRHKGDSLELFPLDRRGDYEAAIALSRRLPRRMTTRYFKLFYSDLS